MKEKIALKSVGLNVGGYYINMVQLSQDPEGLRVLDFASIDLTPHKGEEEEEKLNQLKKMVQEKAIADCGVNIGISGEAVIVRYIDLPKMSKKEVGQALKYEAQQYIPFKLEEVIFDYHILTPISTQENKVKVLLAAVKREAIKQSVGLIQQARLAPDIIDVNSFSLINCFQINGPQVKKDDVFALVNLDFDVANIDILQGETPFFTRDISLSESVLSLGSATGEEEDFLEKIKPVLTTLIREVQLSIHYFESEFDKQISVIYVSGAGAMMYELVKTFANQLGREVSQWNPLQNLLIDSAQVDTELLQKRSPMLALACGLALRGVK